MNSGGRRAIATRIPESQPCFATCRPQSVRSLADTPIHESNRASTQISHDRDTAGSTRDARHSFRDLIKDETRAGDTARPDDLDFRLERNFSGCLSAFVRESFNRIRPRRRQRGRFRSNDASFERVAAS